MDCMNRSGKFDKKFEAFIGNLCKLSLHNFVKRNLMTRMGSYFY
jgi:hypothetical protein